MKNIIFKTIFILLIIALSFILLNNRESETLVIGGLFNLTGYGSFAGESSRDGVVMAMEDFGYDENKIKLVTEDTESDLRKAVAGASKLINVDKAIVVIGPEWTEFGEVVSPIAVKNKVPFISPWVVAEAPFVKPPYFWSATPSDRSEHSTVADYLSANNLNRISVIYSNNFWSRTNMRILREEISFKNNLSIISEYKLNQSENDFRLTITKIKVDKPDIIYAAIAEDQGYGAFVSQARQLGVTAPIASHSARASSPIMKERYPSFLQNQIFAEMIPSEKKDEFEIKYEKRFGKKPQAPSAMAAYDMTTIILNATKEGADTSEKIISYLKSMEPHEGYSGLIKFDENGQLPRREAAMKEYDSEGKIVEII